MLWRGAAKPCRRVVVSSWATTSMTTRVRDQSRPSAPGACDFSASVMFCSFFRNGTWKLSLFDCKKKKMKMNYATLMHDEWRNKHSLAILLVSVLRMIFNTIHILVALFTPRHRTRERFLVGAIRRWRSTSVSHDKLRAELLGRPRFIAVFRFRYHYLIFIHFAAYWKRKHIRNRRMGRERKRKSISFPCYIARSHPKTTTCTSTSERAA